MLSVILQFIAAMIAYAVNERMAGQLDYLREEVWFSQRPLRRQPARPGSI
jgi:hypothetical protein